MQTGIWFVSQTNAAYLKCILKLECMTWLLNSTNTGHYAEWCFSFSIIANQLKIIIKESKTFLEKKKKRNVVMRSFL